MKSPSIPGDILSFTNSGLTIKTVDYDIVITHLQFPNKTLLPLKMHIIHIDNFLYENKIYIKSFF